MKHDFNSTDMVVDDVREQKIKGIAEMLRLMPFSIEYVVRKKPKGVKVIVELTQQEIDYLSNKMAANMED